MSDAPVQTSFEADADYILRGESYGLNLLSEDAVAQMYSGRFVYDTPSSTL